MRLGMVRTPAGEPSVAVFSDGRWVPLLTVPGADRLGPARTDLLAFLGAGDQAHQLARGSGRRTGAVRRAGPAAQPAVPSRRRSGTARCGRNT